MCLIDCKPFEDRNDAFLPLYGHRNSVIKMRKINEIINYKYDIYVSISILIGFIILIEYYHTLYLKYT